MIRTDAGSLVCPGDYIKFKMPGEGFTYATVVGKEALGVEVEGKFIPLLKIRKECSNLVLVDKG